jgi:hypothetical protein
VVAEKIEKSKELLCQRHEEETNFSLRFWLNRPQKYLYLGDLLFLQLNLENSTTSNLDDLYDIMPHANNSEESG